MTSDKIQDALFQRDPSGLIWIEAPERDDDAGPYRIWLLVDPGTDRVLASIDGPTTYQLTYVAVPEGGTTKRFLSLDGAKRYALSASMQILQSERSDKIRARRARLHV